MDSVQKRFEVTGLQDLFPVRIRYRRIQDAMKAAKSLKNGEVYDLEGRKYLYGIFKELENAPGSMEHIPIVTRIITDGEDT